MFKRVVSFFLTVSFFSCVGLSGVAFGADVKAGEGVKTSEDRPFSAVEALIFDSPHMKNTNLGETLNYTFERKGVFGDDYKDSITIDIAKGDDAAERTISVEFFTGQRRRPYPTLGHVTSNPLLTLYFNKDAWDLARRIKAKGTANYLRNRIIDSLSSAKEIKDTTCTFDGKQVPAKQVTVRPYFEDSNKHHLVHYHGMIYNLTLSKDVPGWVCQIQSIVPFPKENVPDHFLERLKKLGMDSLYMEADMVNKMTKTDTPLLVETLSFVGAVPTKSVPAKK